MSGWSRRALLQGAAALASSGSFAMQAIGATAPFGPGDKFDLLIKGGEMLDPSQNLQGRRDIGIRNALIAAVEREIPVSHAKQVLDVRDRLVLPGLVDFHAHVFQRPSQSCGAYAV